MGRHPLHPASPHSLWAEGMMLPAPGCSHSVSAQGSRSQGGDRWGHAGHEAFVWPVVAAAQTRRWRLPWGRGRSPWPGKRWALGIRPFCWGLTSGSGPFPAAPHQPFHFQLDLLLSHGNGMQIGLGLPGSRLRAASRSPSLGVIPSQIGWPAVPGVRGVPLSPSNGAAATLCPGRPSPLLTHGRY